MTAPKPLAIIVFGATGDLFGKKLAPALFALFRRGLLPEHVRIIGLGRRMLSDQEFQTSITSALSVLETRPEIVTAFGSLLSYVQGDSVDVETYQKVLSSIAESDARFGAVSDKLIYLAVAPKLYPDILRNLAHSGLAKAASDSAFARILIEKPFGGSLSEAEDLTFLIDSALQSDAIFRVDHYLAKGPLVDLVRFRREHPELEKYFQGDAISRIEVRFLESATAARRGAFYDTVGAFRDVGQNHMLQMLAAALVPVPAGHASAEMQALRARFLASLSVADGEHAAARRGQYDGYLDESGVRASSDTETYFKMQLRSALPAFREVPIILEGGKGMSEPEVSVKMFFKGSGEPLTCALQPIEALTIPDAFGGSATEFMRANRCEGPSAYEQVFLAAQAGDQEFFVGTDEALAAWRLTDAILESLRGVPLERYPAGRAPVTR